MATPTSQIPSMPQANGAPPLGPELPVVWPGRMHTRLANGLEVVLVEHHAIPKFTGELFLRSGNAAVADRATGLATITASVVRTGTARRTSRQIEEDLRRMGADLSSSAGADTSAIAFAGLAESADGLLGLVNELAREASFPEAEFERERRQLFEEVRIERTTPGFLANERLRKVLFGAHPYAQVSPSESQVTAYRREDLVETYRAAYRPGNALLILLGDFRAEEMLARVEKVFGGWQGDKPPAPGAAEPPVLRGRRVYLVDLPGAVQTQVLVGCHSITRKHSDWIRLGLANAIYGGAFNSRLVMNIREAKGYTYSPRSGVHALQQYGYFSIHAAVRNDVVAATLTEMFYELDRMRALPVPEDELADARNYLSGVFSLGLATQDGQLGQLSTLYLNDLPEDYLEKYRERVRALSADEVLAAARTYFDSANAQIVIVGDRSQVEAQARLFGPAEICDTQGTRLE
jgi:zinc protease